MEVFEADTPTEGDVAAAGGAVRIELAHNHEGKVQWWAVRDRSAAPTGPIIADPAVVARQPRSAYVLLRPTGDLADAFVRWQGELLDRLGGVPCTVPAAHVTMKAFGATDAPIAATDEPRIAEVVSAWASATPPLRLRAAGLELWDGDEPVPVLTIAMDDAFRAALADLWTRCADAGLPGSYSDHIGTEGWRAHLSLCYPETQPAPAIWEPLRAFAAHADVGDAASTADCADLVVFGDGAERRAGRSPFRR
jgi:2'-5' RNA ligase